jgi:UDP-N-acetylglucosamine--N-acetylmuramyl-(pentapeptide) pyrophosphoryl-undecaprenol N-acetylglucosamine transferase
MDQVMWVGSQGGIETDLVKRSNIPFAAIPAAGVHGVGVRQLPRNLWKLGQGVFASRRILNEFKPDVLLFTGGYVAFPMAVANRSIPTLLYVPDIEPGWALKTLGRFADRIAVTTDETFKFYPPHIPMTITGYPTRAGLADLHPSQARKKLGLDNDHPVLLVAGGSTGTRSISQALVAILPNLLQDIQIIHITGQRDWVEIQTSTASLPDELASRYHAFPYLHEMGAALAAADLAVSRAGGSTLGEYPLFGLPAVLVPYPYAWRYQKVNADYLAGHGAAVILEDARLKEELLPTIRDLVTNTLRLETMRTAMRSLATPRAAAHLAELVKELGSRTKSWRRA